MTPFPEPEVDAPLKADAPIGDRGISPIAGRLGGRQGRMITMAAVAVGCGIFLAAGWDRGDDPPGRTAVNDAPPRELSPFEPARREAEPLLSDADTDPRAPTLSDETVPSLELEPSRTGSDGSASPSPAQTRQALADSARRAPVLAYSRSGEGEATRREGRPDTETVAPRSAATALDDLRRIGPIGRAEAGRLPDRNLLLTAGTSVPCVLQTAMDSGTPGYVSCVLPADVYSESGGVVLLERGTRVLGEYRGGLQQGRSRLFVLWTRAVTPTGVAIALASPAADALGRAGFGGTVDGRFWERFGGALLLSLVDDGAYAAFGSDRETIGASRAPSDAASTALQGSVDIPPTLRKAQGSEVSIFIAQDLDFRGVYRLRAR